ncbi:hypothetical protein ACWT_2830 [Actinoplanes sp. SE50]|uniref:hypothetical protein n=1 Tax=unclassified Actinoplanes TaxID=2626549 RepID=UPI00023EC443|nr:MULTISPECIES: hypothetical protein [unclassified Actinoplanes]AEV83611.1 hypothetical protein ACPL_2716 [Actinoplanes sp. SE50/110]ATO82245.1 hypothetical protein ACWT_2830 [Actinoplanes sp. SE50]SLL99652.1 hypothetical protein ACSP50_2883 [Actinoplanes sp. SE50/110]
MSYALDDATMHALCAVALRQHPSANRFVALALSHDDPLADVARTVERVVFEESFQLGETAMVAEYTAYEEQSYFFLVLDRETGMPAGAARAIEGGGKTLDDAPDLIGKPLSEIVDVHGMHDGGKIWDYATLAVLPRYRSDRSGLTVSVMLYRAFINAGHRWQVRHVVCMLDQAAFRNLDMLGCRFIPMAGSEPFEYLGSAANRALYIPFDEIARSMGDKAELLLSELNAPDENGRRRPGARRITARLAGQVSSGEDLDPHIELPGFERRRQPRR